MTSFSSNALRVDTVFSSELRAVGDTSLDGVVSSEIGLQALVTAILKRIALRSREESLGGESIFSKLWKSIWSEIIQRNVIELRSISIEKLSSNVSLM